MKQDSESHPGISTLLPIVVSIETLARSLNLTQAPGHPYQIQQRSFEMAIQTFANSFQECQAAFPERASKCRDFSPSFWSFQSRYFIVEHHWTHSESQVWASDPDFQANHHTKSFNNHSESMLNTTLFLSSGTLAYLA
jgi:hypothetical protein